MQQLIMILKLCKISKYYAPNGCRVFYCFHFFLFNFNLCQETVCVQGHFVSELLIFFFSNYVLQILMATTPILFSLLVHHGPTTLIIHDVDRNWYSIWICVKMFQRLHLCIYLTNSSHVICQNICISIEFVWIIIK